MPQLNDAQRQLVRESFAERHLIDAEDLMDCDDEMIVETIEKHSVKFLQEAFDYCHNHHSSKVRAAVSKV